MLSFPLSLLLILVGAYLGYAIPEFWLGGRIKKRQHDIMPPPHRDGHDGADHIGVHHRPLEDLHAPHRSADGDVEVVWNGVVRDQSPALRVPGFTLPEVTAAASSAATIYDTTVVSWPAGPADLATGIARLTVNDNQVAVGLGIDEHQARYVDRSHGERSWDDRAVRRGSGP